MRGTPLSIHRGESRVTETTGWINGQHRSVRRARAGQAEVRKSSRRASGAPVQRKKTVSTWTLLTTNRRPLFVRELRGEHGLPPWATELSHREEADTILADP